MLTLLAALSKAITHPARIGRAVRGRLEARFAWRHRLAQLRPPVHDGPVRMSDAGNAAIARDLAAAGVRVEPLVVSLEEFGAFVERARFGRFLGFHSGGPDRVAQKAMEYYLAAHLLGLREGMTYLDVASQDSPAPRLYSEMFRVRTFRQDLAYPAGLQGDRIGGSAARMDVPDGFADAIALHNAFEHFEQDADLEFVREAARVLRPGGRLCIVPLFLHTEYAIQTDPSVSLREPVPFEPDATLYAAPGWNDRHGRWYDVAHFVRRIAENAGSMRLTVHAIQNSAELGPAHYTRFVAVFERP